MGPAHIGQHTMPRNCFPSLHLAWTLELVLYSQSHLRRIAIVYLVLIAASTIGIGEHYMVDLVAAVPYAIAIYWIEPRLFQNLQRLGWRNDSAIATAPAQKEVIADEVEVI